MSREIDPPVIVIDDMLRTAVSDQTLQAWGDWTKAERRLAIAKQRYRVAQDELRAAQRDRDSAKLVAGEALQRSAREEAEAERPS